MPAAPVQNPPQPLLPPEERFWQRYSPYNEFPISTVGAIAIFLLSFVALIVFSQYLLKDSAAEPIELGGPIEVIPGGGGGGGTGGSGNERPEAVEKSDPNEVLEPVTPLEKIERPTVEPKQLADVVPPDSEAVRFIQQGNLAAASLAKVRDDLRQDLMKGLSDPGSGGGKGGGDGTGVGKGKGPGTGTMSDRQKRVLRWTMIFDTQNGADYRNQLQALGAILAIPSPDGRYLVIRNLAQPRPQPEDVSKIQRIFWIDERPESVGPLMRAMGLNAVPHVVAFFPEKLEKDLLGKELRFRNRPESEILETRFRVMRRGASFDPVVVDQR